MEQKAKAMLKNYLTSEAYERMANIRISNPELYSQLLSLVAYLAQQGKINSSKRLGEEELKQFASKVVAKTRHETTITRRNK